MKGSRFSLSGGLRRQQSLRVGTVLLALLSPAAAAGLQTAAPLEAAARALLEHEIAGQPGDIEISVQPLAAPQLPACDQLQAFLPAGQRAWGQLRVGVRCLGPSPWTVWLQARVRVFADYVVSRRALRSGEQITHDDIALRHGELSALPDQVLTEPAQAIGQLSRFALAAGAPLRAHQLRAADTIRRGQQVSLHTHGPGFSVSGEAQALGNAAPGERLRLRLPNGQIVHGRARRDGSAELEP